MSDTYDKYRTPGQLVTALLRERGWTNRILAVVLGMTETVVSKIASDNRKIDAKTAVLLEEVFGIDAEQFLLLQKQYDLAKARIETVPDPRRAVRARIFGELPISDMIKRGWIEAESIRDVEAVEKELCRFFGVNRLEDAEVLPHAAKKTGVSIEPSPAQLAWLYRVRKIASEMLVGSYSQAAAEAAIEKLKPLRGHPEHMRRVPRILAEAGIRFVIVEGLPRGKIDGVCFWLDENSPVIGMTLRFDRIDNFLFVLRHEMEHVIRRDGLGNMAMLDVDLGSNTQTSIDETVLQQENNANAAAREFCVPQKMIDAFISRKAPFFSERDLIGFAKTLNVHPGLVAGQLQWRTDQYQKFRNHLAPVRSIVAPNAVSDGWGDIYPVEP